MTASDLRALLDEFYRDKVKLLQRHVAGAEHVNQYDFNNTYQFIIARDEVHVSWLAAALLESGGSPGNNVETPELPEGAGDRTAAIFEDDARQAQQMVDKWRERVEQIGHARHQLMLRVVLGETLEHRRFFEQALEGRHDLLGRHPADAGSRGVVLPTRWLE